MTNCLGCTSTAIWAKWVYVPDMGMRSVLEGKNGNFRCWYAWVWIRYSTDTVWGMVRVQERVKTEKKIWLSNLGLTFVSHSSSSFNSIILNFVLFYHFNVYWVFVLSAVLLLTSPHVNLVTMFNFQLMNFLLILTNGCLFTWTWFCVSIDIFFLLYLNSWCVLVTTFYGCHCTCLLFIIPLN